MNYENKFNLPESIPDLYESFHLPKSGRLLIFGDVHVPYHNMHALSVMIEKALMSSITMILINGDFFDHYSLSPFSKDP